MPRTPPLESVMASLLWLIIKEPGLAVPLRYLWKYVGVGLFRYGRVRRIVASRIEPPCVREFKFQASPPQKGGKKKAQRVVEHNCSTDGSCDGEPLSLAQDVKRELARGNASWHSMRVHHLHAVNAMGPYICGASIAMVAFIAWLE